MATATDIRKGRVIQYQGAPHLILDMMHRTPGRRTGFVQTTLRNLNTNSSTVVKFGSTDTIEFCQSDAQKLEFSYVDDTGYHFMDPESFEDIALSKDLIEDQKQYLVPSTVYDILFVNHKPIRVQLPAAVSMKVMESADGIKGDSASNVQKPATMETGLVVQVPLFIKPGEILRVSTEDGTYLGRA